MIISIGQTAIRLKQTLTSHAIICTLGSLMILSLILPTVFPVYFRADDVVYLDWARTHAWVDCFRPSVASLFGMFRPVQNIAWWSLYHLAGLNPYPYHVAVLFSYLVSLAVYLAFIKTAFSTRVALASMATYGVCFYFLTYIVFWFSDLTYTLELMFANGALWFFALAIKLNMRRYLAGTFALFCIAVAAKEPAAFIIPLVCACLLFVKWEHLDHLMRRRSAFMACLMLVAGISWILVNPAVQSRQGIPLGQGASDVIAFLMHRWAFYAGSLTAFPAILVLAAALYPLLQKVLSRSTVDPSRSQWIAAGVSVVLTLLLKTVPDLAMLILMLALPLLILSRHPSGVGAIWAAPAILGIMTIDYMVQTYLVEASFGLALICGTSIVPLVDRIIPHVAMRSGRRKQILAMCACAILALFMGMTPFLSGKLHALRILSANRQNFASAISYLTQARELIPIPLLIIDYSDMGLVYERNILPLGDEEKALRQKTMTSQTLEVFLAPASIPVHNLEWWQTHTEIKEAALLTLNVQEEEFLNGTMPRKRLLREWSHGETHSRLYRIDRDLADPSHSESNDSKKR